MLFIFVSSFVSYLLLFALLTLKGQPASLEVVRPCFLAGGVQFVRFERHGRQYIRPFVLLSEYYFFFRRGDA